MDMGINIMTESQYDDIVEYISIAYAIFNWLARVYDNYKRVRRENAKSPLSKERNRTRVGRILHGIGLFFENAFFAVKTLPVKIFKKK